MNGAERSLTACLIINYTISEKLVSIILKFRLPVYVCEHNNTNV